MAYYYLGIVHYHQNDLKAAERCFSAVVEAGFTMIKYYAINGACGLALTYQAQGTVLYHCNQLAEAEASLKPVVEDRFCPNIASFLWSAFALSLTRQAQGHPEEARELIESAINQLLERGNSSSLALAQAFEAKLALRQGRLAEALQWANTFDTERPPAGFEFFVPKLTVAKILLCRETEGSLKQAGELLTGMHDFFTSTHNTRFMIEVLALQSLVDDALDDDAAALRSLGESLRLAEPGGFIRLFVDLGPKMAKLLHRAIKQHIAVRYIGQLLTAFKHEELSILSEIPDSHAPHPSSAPLQPLLDPLTKREIEIVTLLAKRLSNQEIADTLFISPETVKRHTINIYQKLDVHGRREAVAKAHELGLLSRG